MSIKGIKAIYLVLICLFAFGCSSSEQKTEPQIKNEEVSLYLKENISQATFSRSSIELAPGKKYVLRLENYVYVKEPGREGDVISPADILKMYFAGEEQKQFSPRPTTLTFIESSPRFRDLHFKAEYLRPVNTGNIPLAGDVSFLAVNENGYAQEAVKIELVEVKSRPSEAESPRRVIGNVVVPDPLLEELEGTQDMMAEVRKKSIEYWKTDPGGKRVKSWLEDLDKVFSAAENGTANALKKAPEKAESFYDKALNRKLGEVSE